MRAIRPERSVAERGRTSPKQLVDIVKTAEIKMQIDVGDFTLEDEPLIF